MNIEKHYTHSPSGKRLFLNSSNIALTNCIAFIILYRIKKNIVYDSRTQENVFLCNIIPPFVYLTLNSFLKKK
jgi:hypothetical protein